MDLEKSMQHMSGAISVEESSFPIEESWFPIEESSFYNNKNTEFHSPEEFAVLAIRNAQVSDQNPFKMMIFTLKTMEFDEFLIIKNDGFCI